MAPRVLQARHNYNYIGDVSIAIVQGQARVNISASHTPYDGLGAWAHGQRDVVRSEQFSVGSSLTWAPACFTTLRAAPPILRV